MKFGFCGASYTLPTSAIADEECINRYLETIETPGAQTQKALLDCPGYAIFCTLAELPTRGQIKINGRYFAVGGTKFYEIASDASITERGTVENDSLAVSMAVTNTQILIVSALKAYCFTLADNTLVEVTNSLVGKPIQAEATDTYFIVIFQDSNKFQVSDPLDGTTWPGLQVNAVSVFPENIRSIKVDHRELWIFGQQHAQPYTDTGSDQVFDVIPGALIEMGSACTFGPQRADNTQLWISEDERGARMAYRASGYTPQRISTHAVEADLVTYADISNLVSYVYQDTGHQFWVLYIPGSQWSWVYDIAENAWHKRYEWDVVTASSGPHLSWNHCYTFGKHLVGDWQSGNIYNLSRDYSANNGAVLRRLRRTPTIVNEMQWITFSQLIIDYVTGQGPQPPLQDGAGNDRQPQSMLRWSDDRGSTWSNEHVQNMGFAGQFKTRVIWWRLGRSRYRVFEESVTDPVRSDVINAYLNPS